MESLRVRESLRGYKRDTYLGSSPTKLDSRYEPIDCATGFAQWGVSPEAAAAHSRFDPSALAAYPELCYDDLLKPAVMNRFGSAELSRDCLFFGHGSFNLAERLIHKLVEPSRMIGPGPQFNEIPSEFVAAGGEYRPMPIKEPSYDFPFEALRRALQQDTSPLYLDNPNNPLGRTIDLGVIAELVGAAEERGVIAMVDEAYGDFIDDQESAIHLVHKFRNLAVVRSFSKALGLAAARVGYMFLSAELAELYRPLDVPFEPSLHSATLACATLRDETFVKMVRATVTATKHRVMETFRESGFDVLPSHPSTSIMAVRKEGWNMAAQMASVGVSIEPGSAFNKTAPCWDDSYCRIRMPRENQTEELCRRINGLAR